MSRHQQPGSKARLPHLHRPPAGTAAGIEYHELIPTPGAHSAHVTCTDYAPDRCEVRVIDDLTTFIAGHRPDWAAVRFENPLSRLRQHDASVLLHAILDTIVDDLYPVLEDTSQRLEEVRLPLHHRYHAVALPPWRLVLTTVCQVRNAYPTATALNTENYR